MKSVVKATNRKNAAGSSQRVNQARIGCPDNGSLPPCEVDASAIWYGRRGSAQIRSLRLINRIVGDSQKVSHVKLIMRQLGCCLCDYFILRAICLIRTSASTCNEPNMVSCAIGFCAFFSSLIIPSILVVLTIFHSLCCGYRTPRWNTI